MRMIKLSDPQRRALEALDQGDFVHTVAGWHLPGDSLNAFQTQTLTALSLKARGLVRMERFAARITKSGRDWLRATEDAEREAERKEARANRAAVEALVVIPGVWRP